MKTNFSVRSVLLMFAVFFTTFPLLIFGALEVFDEFDERNETAREMTRRSAVRVQQDVADNLRRFQALLEGLSLEIDLKTLRARDPEKLIRLLKAYPQLMGVIVFNRDAFSVAAYSTGLNIPIGIDYTDRSQIIEAKRTKRTAISGHLVGRATGVPAIVIAVPILDEKEEIAAFLSGGMAPDKLLASSAFGSEEYGLVIDSYGQPVLLDKGTTSVTAEELTQIGKALAEMPDGVHRYRLHNQDVDIQTVSIEPIAWKVFVGVAPEYLRALGNAAFRRTALLVLACAMVSMLITSIVSLAAARGVDKIGDELKRMSAVEPHALQVSTRHFVPTEFQRLIANFNQLIERTRKAKLAELEAISRVAASILIAGPDGTIRYINENGLATFGNVLQRNLKDLIDGEVRQNICFRGAPREWKGDATIYKPDGTRFDGFVSTTPILDNGEVSSVVAIIQDITRTKAERESLIQSEG
jgi:PAS domain S-box-containing protein